MLPLVHELNVPPWEAMRAIADLPYPLFFDSAAEPSQLSRYSYLMADPVWFIRSKLGQVTISGQSLPSSPPVANPLELLSDWLRSASGEISAGLPPFQGGLAGLFSYDLVHHLERVPRHSVDEFQAPDLAVGCYDWVYAFDHQRQKGWIIAWGESGQRQARLEFARNRLTRPPAPLERPMGNPLEVHEQFATPLGSKITSNFSRADFVEAIRSAIAYVHAGDCFQVNIAQRLLFPQREHPLELYGRLRELNPAPFCGYFDLGDFAIASASPERFIRLDATGLVETRPIKGTRPRGKSPDEDRRLAAELCESAKDRAENIMIVDLLRNDLGRVCAYGSVEVPGLCELESYPTVHHLVSTVRGRLRQEMSAFDLLLAAFPGGSVTGAPKIRAMEIIAELEPTSRGPYCGSLGWIGFDGAMDTSILIRTFTIGKGWMQFPVGGGIVADSDPCLEYEETLHKAAGLLRAIDR